MSTSSSSKRRRFRRADWFVGARFVAAASIVSTAFFLESPTDPGLVFIRKVEDVLASASETRGVPRDGGVATTSYDPPAKAAAADDPFARTAAFRPPGGPAHPQGGEGQSASEA